MLDSGGFEGGVQVGGRSGHFGGVGGERVGTGLAGLLTEPGIDGIAGDSGGRDLHTLGFGFEVGVSLFRQRQVKVFHASFIMPC